MSREQRIIELAGGEYLGTQDGMAWYNEPVTHSTMMMDTRTLADAKDHEAAEFIKILMRRKRQEFAVAAAAAIVRQRAGRVPSLRSE